MACPLATYDRTLVPVKWPLLKSGVLCVVLVSLLATTSHYLAHYHFPGEGRSLPQEALGYEQPNHAHDGLATERCGLCLQLDRLPAPPSTLAALTPSLILIATVDPLPEPQAIAQIAAWQPPPRGPPTRHAVI
jgi:hypothetical protein